MFRAIQILILLICVTGLRAQDLIVTTSGDSIHCTITTVQPNRLFYTVKDATGDRRDNIDVSHVAMYKREGYFPVILGTVDERAASHRKSTRGRWLLAVHGGVSHRTAEVADDLSPSLVDYVEGQRNGSHLGGSLHYLINDEVALGVSYSSFFGADNSMAITVTLQDSSKVNGIMADDVRLRWAALNLLYDPVNVGPIGFYGSIAAGPLFYKDYATLINNYTITGSALGFGATLGLDCRLGHDWSIGAQLSYILGSISRFEVDFGSTKASVNVPEQYSESVNRLDLGLTLRLRL